MSISTTEYKHCHMVTMTGRIDSSNGDDLLAAFKAVHENGVYKVVFDMTDVDFMSSKGWWVLVETQKTCKRYNRGELVLSTVPENILSSLDLIGMSHYFKLFDDTVSAVGFF